MSKLLKLGKELKAHGDEAAAQEAKTMLSMLTMKLLTTRNKLSHTQTVHRPKILDGAAVFRVSMVSKVQRAKWRRGDGLGRQAGLL